MKTSVIFICLALITLSSCSKDELDEPDTQTSITTLKQGEKIESKPFNLKGSGKFEYVSPRNCESAYQIHNFGTIHSDGYGDFETSFNICTNGDGPEFLKGFHMDREGDRLFFYAEDKMINNDGSIKFKIIYYQGTGKWQNSSGKAHMTYDSKSLPSKIGYFELRSEGEISH